MLEKGNYKLKVYTVDDSPLKLFKIASYSTSETKLSKTNSNDFNTVKGDLLDNCYVQLFKKWKQEKDLKIKNNLKPVMMIAYSYDNILGYYNVIVLNQQDNCHVEIKYVKNDLVLKNVKIEQKESLCIYKERV